MGGGVVLGLENDVALRAGSGEVINRGVALAISIGGGLAGGIGDGGEVSVGVVLIEDGLAGLGAVGVGGGALVIRPRKSRVKVSVAPELEKTPLLV